MLPCFRTVQQTYSLIYEASEDAPRLNFVLWRLIFSAKFLQPHPTDKNAHPAARFRRHYSIAACRRSGTQILDITLRYIDNLCSPALQATTVSDSSIVTDRGSCEERRELRDLCPWPDIIQSLHTQTQTNKLTNVKITFLHTICHNSDMFWHILIIFREKLSISAVYIIM